MPASPCLRLTRPIVAGMTLCLLWAGGTVLVGAEPLPRADEVGNTSVAEAEKQPAPAEAVTENKGPATYADNHWLGDFETHFLISLPFTALYSYAAVVSLDGLVQGSFPPTFRQADMWMVIGLAVGSSMAIALGSANRVPDQSTYRVSRGADPWPEPAQPKTEPAAKLDIIRVTY